MPSEAYIRAAVAANRQPVVLMQVESPGALRASVASQSDWDASASLVNIDTRSAPGEAGLAWGLTEVVPSAWTADRGLQVRRVVTTLMVGNTHNHLVSGTFNAWMTLKRDGQVIGTYRQLFHIPGSIETYIAEPVTWFIPELPGVWPGQQIAVTDVGCDVYHSGGTYVTNVRYESPVASGSLTTRTLDLGEVPTVPSVFHAADRFGGGAAITYSALGGNADPPTVDLGAVTDGGTLAPYRYYRISAALTNDSGNPPAISEISITGGDSQYVFISTHRDEPVPGAQPLLSENPVGNLSSKIELMDKSTTGKLSVKMAWNRETHELIRGGGLKGRTVSVLQGYAGQALADYEPLLVGQWHDYDADLHSRQVKVEVRDVWQQFAGRKLPAEATRADGTRAVKPLEFLGANIFQAMLDLIDAVGVREVYIPRTSYEALRDAHPAWTVTRTITEPTDVPELLTELSVLAGVFLSPQPSGVLAPVEYLPAAEPADYIDVNDVQVGGIKGGQEKIVTTSIVYYRPIVADPGEDEEDYAASYAYVNATTVNELGGQVVEKRFYDKWSCSDAVIQALAARMDSWFARPHLRLDLDDVPPRHMAVRAGQVVAVDNLPLPELPWPGLSAGRKFLCMGRNYDARTGTLSLELMDLQTSGDPGSGVAGTTLVISGPDNPYGPVNTYTVAGGTPPFAWSTTLGTLSGTGAGSPITDETGTPITDETGAVITLEPNVNLNVSGLTGSGTLIVTDGIGKVTKRFTVLPPMVLGVVVEHGDGGTVLRWSPGDRAWVEEYEVRKGAGAFAAGEFVYRGRVTEVNLGLLSAAQTHTYQISAIEKNNGLPSGEAAIVPITIEPPTMLSLISRVIDNNVLLWWTAAPGSYPILAYRVYRGDTWGAAVFQAEASGTFYAVFEREAGTFTYWLQPLDLAGNFGPQTSLAAKVSEPPDYVLTANVDSAFDGTLSDLVPEFGKLYGPFATAETWQSHFSTRSWNSPQDQIDAGYPFYLQPVAASGYYEEVHDYGAQIPSTMITLTATWGTLTGSPILTPNLQVSADGVSYTDLGNTWESRADSFRYVKWRITLTGGLAEISGVNLTMETKEKTDAGSGTANSGDTNGTPVAFGKTFADVLSLTVTAKYQAGVDGIDALYDFEDVPNPTGFTVYLFRRSDGARISGDFSWTARGV